MDKFQKIFDSQLNETINEKIDNFLGEKLKRKFLEQGIKLNKKKVFEITKKIREGKGNKINFNTEDDSSDKDIVKDIKIDLTDIDTKGLLSDFNLKLKKAIPNIVIDSSKYLFKELKRKAYEHIKLLRSDRANFEAKLERRWKKPFTLLEIYLVMVFEVGVDSNENYRQNCGQNPDIVFEVLIRLHARASQIALEVLTLIKAGLADGAHARWRTLHEVAVVSQFIKKHGKDVAERYDFHNFVESYKATLQYQQYAKALNQKKVSKAEMTRTKKKYDDSLIKFGTNFKEQYGWASAALNKTKPNFADIESDIGMDKWRPYYKMASHNVHANPKGISFRLGLSDKSSQIMLAGVSDTGFADPAHGTAISLLQITSTILLNQANIDSLIMLDVLKQFENLIGEEFLRTQIKFESK